MTHPLGSSSAGGFARAEALVLIAGSVVVVSLSLPLAAGNAEHARTSLCLDNLRRLGVALSIYSTENGWYPPSPDDGNTNPGFSWVPGQAGPGGPQEFDSRILADAARSLL